MNLKVLVAHTMKYFFWAVTILLHLPVEADETVYRFINGRILYDHSIAQGELWTSQGKIIAPQQRADAVIDVEGLIIAPGYIDLQINGAFGIDFTLEPERVNEVAKKLPRYGVTSFLPTCITSSKEQYQHALPVLRKQLHAISEGAQPLGIHLEGPFFNMQQKGAHNALFVKSCESIGAPEEMYGSLDDVKVVTLAPELSGACEIISQLHEKGIVVSAGHTSASYEEMQKAIDNGVCFATHLFNAMVPLHHREPGVIGAVLMKKGFMYSVIADPHHLHPRTLELAWRLNPDGLVLVSDAMAALGLPAGLYHLGTMQVEVEGGKATIFGTKTLAGSIIALDSAVRYLISSTGCSKVEAIEAATLKPATLLSIQHQKGTLRIGADADFILLDDDLVVHATYINGREYKFVPGAN